MSCDGDQLTSRRGLRKVKLRAAMPCAGMVETSKRAPASSASSGVSRQLAWANVSPRFSLTLGLAPGNATDAPSEMKLELPFREL